MQKHRWGAGIIRLPRIRSFRLRSSAPRDARLAHVLGAVLLATTVALVAPSLATADDPSPQTVDDFNRADEDPLSQSGAWSSTPLTGSSHTLEVISGMAGQNEDENAQANSYRLAQQSGNAEAAASMKVAPDNGQELYLYVHLQQPGSELWDGYRATLHRSFALISLTIERINNGVATKLAPTGPGCKCVPQELATFSLRRIGTELELWRKVGGSWTKELSAFDSQFSYGHLGLGTNDEQAKWDDFGGGHVTSSSGPPLTRSRGVCSGRGVHAIATSRCLSDPVNTLTGAFITQVDDVQTAGTGVAFAWSRSYTSEDPTVGRLGLGWTDSYATSLLVHGNGDVLLHGDEGQHVYYTRQGDGSFAGDPGSLSTLRSIAGGYELVRSDQVVYVFDPQGRLTSMKDRNGQGLSFVYDGQGRLATITDAANRQVTVTYKPSTSLVERVATPDGRSVVYDYLSGRLSSVTDVRGKLWTYEYDAGGNLRRIVDPLGHAQVTNVYGADGRVETQSDAVGEPTTFAWDAQTQTATATDAREKVWKEDYANTVLASQTDPANRVTSFGHADGDLNETSVTSPTSEQTTMTYDPAGNMLTATAPASLESAQKTFTYSARNDPETVTDARGKLTDYVYFPSGANLLKDVIQDGTRIASYTYFPEGQVETSTDGNEKTTTYTYDPNGNLESVTDPLGNTTTYDYWPDGNVKTRTEPKGCATCIPQSGTWSYTWNPAGQLLTETDPLGHVVQTNVYDDAGRLERTTDANGHVTTYTYYDDNRLRTETRPDPDGQGPDQAPVTTYTYDEVGNEKTVTDPLGRVTTNGYDDANRLDSTTGPDPDGAGSDPAPVTTHHYDPNGNLEWTVEPRGNVQGANPNEFRTTFAYDAAGRLKTETRPDPDGAGPKLPSVTTTEYDKVGNVEFVRDANGHETTYTHDAAGRIRTVTAPDGGLTTYDYDDAGNLETRTDDNGHVTTWAYDDAGRLASETLPDPDGAGGTPAPLTTHDYDPNGNLKVTVDPNGNATPTNPSDGATTYGYDDADRLTSIVYSSLLFPNPLTPEVTFSYDDAGNRLQMTDGSGTETRAYDDLDRLKSVTRGTDTFSYEYDAVGNVKKRTYPGGAVVDYGYDGLDRLHTVNGGQETSYRYDAASNLTQTTFPAVNGQVETRLYDRAGRLTEVKTEKAGVVLARFVSDLDPVGNPLSVVRTGTLAETQTYTYDANDRLKSACFQAGTCPNPNDPFIRWTYDRVGNRLSEARPPGTLVSSYNALDQETSSSYDQNGNQLTGAGGRTFSYDQANRLKTTTQGATTTTYAYDGEGKRLQAATGPGAAEKTNFLWDVSFGLPQLGLERDGAGALLRRYVYGERRLAMIAPGSTSYFHHDLLGSSVHLTGGVGALRWTYAYEPFGAIRTEQQGSGTQPANFMKFTGEQFDPTGLYHLRARQYSAGTGRFLQLDPVSLDKAMPLTSRYVYVSNRATTLVDPTGATFRPANEGRSAPYVASSPMIELGPDEIAREVPGPAGRRRVAFAFQFFMDKGFRYFQSAGLVGNFLHETKGTLDPRTKQDPSVPGGPHGPGRGIAQWEIGARWDLLLNFARDARVSPWALTTQVHFVWRELNSTESLALTALRSTGNVRGATFEVMDKYERPSAPHFASRLRFARYVLKNFG